MVLMHNMKLSVMEWMEMEITVLSETNQAQIDKYHGIISHMQNLHQYFLKTWKYKGNNLIIWEEEGNEDKKK